MSRRWAVVALGLVGLLVAAGTLGPPPSALFVLVARGAHREGLHAVTYGWVELAANVVLFVPVGFLVSAALPRVRGRLVWAGCTAASAAVELVQTVLPDRQPSLVDVLANSAGAALGVLLHAAADRRRRRPL